MKTIQQHADEAKAAYEKAHVEYVASYDAAEAATKHRFEAGRQLEAAQELHQHWEAILASLGTGIVSTPDEAEGQAEST